MQSSVKLLVYCLLSLTLLSAFSQQSIKAQETIYQPQNGMAEAPGYMDKQLGKTSYQIDIYASRYTRREVMREMGYRRASEIALENGYPYFSVTYAMDITRQKKDAITGLLLDFRSKPLFRMTIDLYAEPTELDQDGRTLFLADSAKILSKYDHD